jgi:hypothetical protein
MPPRRMFGAGYEWTIEPLGRLKSCQIPQNRGPTAYQETDFSSGPTARSSSRSGQWMP